MNLHKVAGWLIVIGAINWGLFAFDWDVAQWLPLGDTVYMVLYVLIGVSGLWRLKGMVKM